ncbi:MAG: chloride channel protein [Thermoanaerobaculia bacterium]|nr:chloride channel protein [Thermoanaerobaculia bacterium]
MQRDAESTPGFLRRLRSGWAGIELTLARRFGLASTEERRFFLLIPAVGVLAALLALLVEFLMDLVRSLIWGGGTHLLEAATTVPRWLVVAGPAFGGLVVGLIVWIGGQKVGGYGMGILVESVVLRQGRVPPKPVSMAALAAVFTVGAGGSLGKEGPMIRLGAMVSSWLGERLGIGPYRLKILVGCGAAAGLAAAYNIPVGGALFAMEVILGNFALEIFGPIVIASVISTLIARAFAGDVPMYAASGYVVESGWELLAYLGLGIVGAVASIGFVFGIRAIKILFARQRFVPRFLAPAFGMALVGVVALWFPHVLGSGFESITLAVEGGLPWQLLLLLPLAKVLATGLTAGGGGAGGMFTPSLFVGAMVGGAYGSALHGLFPGVTANPGAYAVVGMAAIAAGASHAPISAILILFEFTGNYDLILPLMIASITASLLSRRLYPHSVYEESLKRRGVDLRYRMEEAALAGLEVEGLKRADTETLSPTTPYAELVERFLATHRQRLFVIGEDLTLLGAVSLHDIKHVLEDFSALTAVVAHDLMVPVDRVVHPRTRLHQVTEAFSQSEFERLPVVDPQTGVFLGVLSKRDVLAIYSQEVLGRPSTLATFVRPDENRDYVELPPDFSLRLVPVPSVLVGKSLAEIHLPQRFGVRIIELIRQRGGQRERMMPAADSVLEANVSMIVIGPHEAVERLRAGRLDDVEGVSAGAAPGDAEAIADESET